MASAARIATFSHVIHVKLIYIVHEKKNTKEIMSVKESIYMIKNSLDLHKLQLSFSRLIYKMCSQNYFANRSA